MNVKKIIAKEGLILVGLVMLGFVILFIAEEMKNYNPSADAIFIPLTIYILYLTFKFVKWAVRTLKER